MQLKYLFSGIQTMSLLHQIALTNLKNIGATLSKTIVAYFGDAEKVFAGNEKRLMKVPGIGEKTVASLNFAEALRKAEAELKFVEKHHIDVLLYTDPRYPKRLKNCNDAPLLLYSRGNTDLNKQHVISIVGTRNATDYGKLLCKQLIEELQQYNVLIVSGLALGIDVAAHKECLRLGVPTIGVLGHGHDRLYPSQNRQVADKMLEQGGILTEYPSGTRPDREKFPARNRIVAGMADATIVVEASIKGGALITAEIANSYNRDVFAFPGRLGDEFSEGCNFLIRNNKAGLITCMADVAFSLGWEKAGSARPKQQLAMPIDLPEDERLIFNILQQYKTLPIDELTIKTGMPMSQLAMALLNMEMQGYITSLPGKVYRLG
ncbi:DNA-processing protein DprA [Mucilaginibacter sp. UR6-1]|uniref:DNA-processing protein DprA n=1 Tax=Mucilaginibacter sp. UR6-1 TaxID=1435643 RepID=UPI001E39E540|nr:DNA-processing protein DprA [Mucilaginibacter sp. UR6-1]MCC8410023.1 DNA-processing protein DprA [Mucilaginibacter sp. UR6-1]